MKTLFLILVSVSSLFAQVRKKQTTEYLTLNTYLRDSVLQKPFKIGYLAYTPDSYYLTTEKYPLIITPRINIHYEKLEGETNCEAVSAVTIPILLLPDLSGIGSVWSLCL